MACKESCTGDRKMPLLLLLLIAISVGASVFAAGLRYPTPIVGDDPARKAGTRLGEEAVRHPWLSRTLRRRLDPEAATGLALTLALVVVILGGLVLGTLAYLIRASRTVVEVDTSVGQWGVDHASHVSTDGLQVVTNLAGTWTVVALIAVVALVEYLRVPNRWVPVFLVAVVVGDVVIVNAIKYTLDRVRPTFNPIAETLGPSFPSGHSATAAAVYAAIALVVARRRSPRVRALLAGAAAAVAVAVAASRVLLGVHWLSDVVAGVAFGWAWFALCAIAFGGRLVMFGAPVQHATEIAEREASPSSKAPAPQQ